MTLEELREEIDRIDAEIVCLLNERAEKALLAGEEKKKDGLPLSDEEREEQVLERVKSMSCGPLDDEAVVELYRSIINACTDLQKTGNQ